MMPLLWSLHYRQMAPVGLTGTLSKDAETNNGHASINFSAVPVGTVANVIGYHCQRRLALGDALG